MAKSSPNNLKKALRLKEKISSERPDFKRSETHRFPRLGDKWRSSKGPRSKMRLKKRSRSAIVETGYRSPVAARGLRMNGKSEVLVCRISDLAEIDRATQVIRISATVGARKRSEIIQAAASQRIMVVNIRPSETAEEKIEEVKAESEEKADADANVAVAEKGKPEDDKSKKTEKKGERK